MSDDPYQDDGKDSGLRQVLNRPRYHRTIDAIPYTMRIAGVLGVGQSALEHHHRPVISVVSEPRAMLLPLIILVAIGWMVLLYAVVRAFVAFGLLADRVATAFPNVRTRRGQFMTFAACTLATWAILALLIVLNRGVIAAIGCAAEVLVMVLLILVLRVDAADRRRGRYRSTR